MYVVNQQGAAKRESAYAKQTLQLNWTHSYMLVPVIIITRDYLFSYIKKMRMHADKVTPERKFLTMETPFMQAYVKLLIHTCHKRGAHAMGGMAAQIPVKNNPKLAAQALESVKKDKVSAMQRAAHESSRERRQ